MHSHHHPDDAHQEEEHHHEEEHSHENETHSSVSEEKEITAVLVKFRNPMAQTMLPRIINEQTQLMTAVPAIEVNRLFTLFGMGINTVQKIAWGIILLSALSIFISLFQSLKERKYELALIRSMGGSSRLEKAGVWWCSMPYAERIRYASYVHHQQQIESRWSREWGDRMNELIFIGQNMEKEKITADLEKCLLQENELHLLEKKIKLTDPFPVNL